MKRSEFKKQAAALFRKHVKGGKVVWLWTFVGKFPTGLDARTGYFVHVKGDKARLFYAGWNPKHGMEVKEHSDLSWELLSKQDQSVIKGGVGNIVSPSEFFQQAS